MVFKLNGPYDSAYLAFSKSMFTVFLSFNEIQESNQIGLGLLKSASVMNIKPQTQKEEIILTPHDNLFTMSQSLRVQQGFLLAFQQSLEFIEGAKAICL